MVQSEKKKQKYLKLHFCYNFELFEKHFFVFFFTDLVFKIMRNILVDSKLNVTDTGTHTHKIIKVTFYLFVIFLHFKNIFFLSLLRNYEY